MTASSPRQRGHGWLATTVSTVPLTGTVPLEGVRMVSATSLLAAATEEPTFDTGDTAWILASAALVLLMTPGLAFFYGGMVRVKSALNMIMMSFVTIGIVSILWVLYGYSVAFGDTGNGYWGGLKALGLGELVNDNVTLNGATYAIP